MEIEYILSYVFRKRNMYAAYKDIEDIEDMTEILRFCPVVRMGKVPPKSAFKNGEVIPKELCIGCKICIGKNNKIFMKPLDILHPARLFIFRLDAGHLGEMIYDNYSDIPKHLTTSLYTEKSLWDTLPKTDQDAQPYLTGKARLPPFRIDFQGTIYIEPKPATK